MSNSYAINFVQRSGFKLQEEFLANKHEHWGMSVHQRIKQATETARGPLKAFAIPPQDLRSPLRSH